MSRRPASYHRTGRYVAATPAAYEHPCSPRRRLGQGAFRMAVTDAYPGAIALVASKHSLPALDAAPHPAVRCWRTHTETRDGLLLHLSRPSQTVQTTATCPIPRISMWKISNHLHQEPPNRAFIPLCTADGLRLPERARRSA